MPTPKFINIDLSGTSGSDGHPAYHTGDSGQPGRAGQDGQDIDVTLSVKSGQIEIAYNQAPKEHYELYAPHKLYLKSDGGNGGKGGDGARGSQGDRGRDATQYNAGTNGGNGGPGGNGGNGGSGGDGGNITIRVHEDDADLLALIPSNGISVSGGIGGSGGVGGSGGAGGAGGAGYSWTERKQNPDGTSYTISKSNPGGRAGSPGHSGANGKKGWNGKDGTIQYIVTDAFGNEQTYLGPYVIKVTKFTLNLPTNNIAPNNAWCEPGERLSLTGVYVYNAGKMPTPKKNSFIFEGAGKENSSWVIFDATQENVLREQVAPGAQLYIGGRFPFQLGHFFATEEPARITATVGIDGRLPRIDKWIDLNAQPQSIRIQYPIVLAPIQGPRAIVPGETPPVAFGAHNLATVNMGGKTERAINITFNTSNAPAYLTRPDKPKTEIPKDTGLSQPLTLKAKGDAIVAGLLDLPLGLSAYTNVKITVTLSIQDVEGKLRDVQKRTLAIQLAEGYVPNHKEIGITLVINSKIDAGILLGWRNLEGLRVDIWNASLYGGFSYRQHAPGDRKTLMESLAHETVVILNNDFTDNAGKERKTTHYLSYEELFQAAQEQDIRTYIVGYDSQFDIGKAILPSPSDTTAPAAPAPTPMKMKAIIQAKQSNNASNQYALKTKTGFFGQQPTVKQLEKQSRRALKTLVTHFPLEKYFAVYDQHEPALMLMRGLNRDTAHISHHSWGDIDINNKKRYQILKMMSFDKKLRLILQFERNDAMLLLLKSAILSDLADEQLVWRKNAWNSPLSKKDLKSGLRHLPALLTFINTLPKAHQEKNKQFLAAVLLELNVTIKKLPSALDRILFVLGRRNVTLSSICREQIIACLKSLGFAREDKRDTKAVIKRAQRGIPAETILDQLSLPPELAMAKQSNRTAVEYVWDRSGLLSAHRKQSAQLGHGNRFYFNSASAQQKAMREANAAAKHASATWIQNLPK